MKLKTNSWHARLYRVAYAPESESISVFPKYTIWYWIKMLALILASPVIAMGGGGIFYYFVFK